MAGSAQGFNTTTYEGLKSSTRYAPFVSTAEAPIEAPDTRSGLSGRVLLIALLVFSVMTVALARGGTGIVERVGISPGALLSFVWLLQGGVALACFLLAIRWMRS